MKNPCKLWLLLGFTSTLAVSTAVAQTNPVVTVDEFGAGNISGVLLPSVIAPDPTGGYLAGPVLIYTLPFSGVQGDVLIHDGALTNAFLDVVRFDGNHHLIFYSDNTDGIDAPADTLSPPSPLFANQAHIVEVGSETFNFADYFPNPNQPGWDPTAPFVSYHFISDIPEPGSMSLLLIGAGTFWCRLHRRSRVS